MTRVAVSGHRGLAPEVTALVATGIVDELERLVGQDGELVGLSCLADGADQIFAEVVLKCGGKLEAVVAAEDYRCGLPDPARVGYDQLISQAHVVYRGAFRHGTPRSYMAASRFMVDRADRLIAVWDGLPARAHGGTADVVGYARRTGVQVSVVWPEGAHRD